MNEKELGELFDNNFDCYTSIDKDDGSLVDEQAMTKNKFIEIVSGLNFSTVKTEESCSIIDVQTESEIKRIYGEKIISKILKRNCFAIDNFNQYKILNTVFFDHSGHTVIFVKRRQSMFD